MPIVINFNNAAIEQIKGGSANAKKVRLDVRDGVLRIRPTDRKAGPHFLPELEPKGKNGLAFTIDDVMREKLGLEGFEAGAKFSLVQDKYGWYAVHPGEDHEKANGARVSVTVPAAGRGKSQQAA